MLEGSIMESILKNIQTGMNDRRKCHGGIRTKLKF